jgi:hypothetical protein
MPALRPTMVLFLLAIAHPVGAQDVASGPEKGKNLPALNVSDLTGAHKGEDVDYLAERKGKPTIYIFVRADKFDRPMAKFMKGLDAAAPKASQEVTMIAVWVTGDAAKSKEYLPIAQQSLKLEATALTCSADGEAGPKGWGINADAHATVVVAINGKAAAVFGYLSLNDAEVRTVVSALKKATQKK